MTKSDMLGAERLAVEYSKEPVSENMISHVMVSDALQQIESKLECRTSGLKLVRRQIVLLLCNRLY